VASTPLEPPPEEPGLRFVNGTISLKVFTTSVYVLIDSYAVSEV